VRLIDVPHTPIGVVVAICAGTEGEEVEPKEKSKNGKVLAISQGLQEKRISLQKVSEAIVRSNAKPQQLIKHLQYI
jgi:hypothetical protein